ncbi:GTP-binding protein [Candidatus Woesearchaeota archaeon]|nr:GTP-binding protein [Candidatus Woesearchaeota archaeon]
MAFNDIKPVEKIDVYSKKSLNKADDKLRILRKRIKGNRLEKSKTLELRRLEIIRNYLADSLDYIVKSFPSVKDLTEFYRQLISANIGIEELKKSFGALNWARKKIDELFRKYSSIIRKAKDTKNITRARKESQGRIFSVLKQVKKDFEFLESARKTLVNLPVVKSGIFTAAIAGFPNVGKSTLLGKLSKSKPKVAGYAFTTKGIMVGYIEKEIQLLDTPGTLDRVEKMNWIEIQAHLAMKLVADMIVYVFDPTETYSLKKQEMLYKRIKKFGKPVVVFVSKTDIAEEERVDELKEKYDALTDVSELKKRLLESVADKP